jgi:GNAT superfamily N-acetyltransferase
MTPRTRHQRLTDPGALLATTHEAGGGLRVRLRLTRPSDRDLVSSFLEGLSPETQRGRFLAAPEAIPEAVVRHFTFYDPRERLVVAAAAPQDGREEIVGLADAAILGTGLAELSVVVDDRAQGRGVGKLLTEAIASLAISQGARQLKAKLLIENPQMLHLMERLGPAVRRVEDGNEVVYAKLPERRAAA